MLKVLRLQGELHVPYGADCANVQTQVHQKSACLDQVQKAMDKRYGPAYRTAITKVVSLARLRRRFLQRISADDI
jgi:uncharacterized protein YecT (DUF1311 family)